MLSKRSRHAGTNQGSLRRRNQIAVYRTLWEVGYASRAELAGYTGLHPATITHIIDEMLARHLVQEVGNREGAIGRPATSLEIVPSAAHVIGINLARNGVSAALVDLRGQFGEVITFGGLNVLHDPHHALNRLVQAVEMLLEEATKTGRRVLGVGIGVPGQVHPETGIVTLSAVGKQSSEKETLPLLQLLGERIRLPLRIDNNANVAILAEQAFGAGREVKTFALLWCDFGVGGGIVVDGHLHRGADGSAGEFGHLTVDTAGPRCACGNSGCLELYAAVPTIRERAAMALSLPFEAVTTEMIADSYGRHAQVSLIVREVASMLTRAAISIVYTLNPDLLIIGGSLGRLAPLFASLIQEQLRATLSASLSNHFRVVGSDTPDVSVRGAATLLIREAVAAGVHDLIA